MTDKQIDERFSEILRELEGKDHVSSIISLLSIIKENLREEYHNADCRKSTMVLKAGSPVSRIFMMCPTCFKKKIFNVNFDAGDIDWINMEIVHNCTSCKCSMVNLDIDIAYDIVKLNRRGYITKWSCSGHDDLDIHLYVSFEDTSFMYNVLKNDIKFPSSLEVEMTVNCDTENDIIIIRGKDKENELKDFHNLTKELFKFKREANRNEEEPKTVV